jgi:hypothetical protein
MERKKKGKNKDKMSKNSKQIEERDGGSLPSHTPLRTKPLSEMQYKFANEYIKNGFNAYRAAINAGYSLNSAKVMGKELVNRPGIQERILRAYAKADQEVISKIAISFGDKAKILLRIINDIVPPDGSEPKREYYSEAIKAMAELNKMQGDYAPDKRLSMTVDATKNKLEEVRRIYEEY